QKVITRAVANAPAPTPINETAAQLFARGIALEEDPGMHQEAINTYLRVLELEPQHAAAHINLGTLYYNRRNTRWPSNTIVRRSTRTPAMRWRISIWVMCWMKPGVSHRQSKPTKQLCSSLPLTRTHTTIWPLPMRRRGSLARRCAIGKLISSSMPTGLGLCTRAIKCNAFFSPTV